MKGRVLTIGGSDSSGGAGIQADIKTISAFGVYAASAVTAVTVQNSVRIDHVHHLPPAIVTAQIRAVLEDIGGDAVKTGMLGTPDVVERVATELSSLPELVPVVVDPVMVSTNGVRLLEEDALHAFKKNLLLLAHILTPNILEAEALTGHMIETVQDMEIAAKQLLDFGPRAILVKGGHLPHGQVCDVFATPSGTKIYSGSRLNSRHTHGTGCTLASALAACLARGMLLGDAVVAARKFVFKAIESAPALGKGCGPLNQFQRVDS